MQLCAGSAFPASQQTPFWFDPLDLFAIDEPERPPKQSLPLLVVLPGLDGSGVTAWTQYPELGLSYDLVAIANRRMTGRASTT